MQLGSPEDLLAVGLRRSRVVMMNEAHDGMQRCVRTREIGVRVLPIAHEAGVRHLAMEALYGPYLTQPDMRRLIDAAEELGWKLITYEARRLPAHTNDREEQQAQNLLEAFAALPSNATLLVWCGWGHLYKERLFDWDWQPMAHQFWEISGVEPFSIDQTVTVGTGTESAWDELGRSQASRLDALGGTAGFLDADSPIPRAGVDAVLLSMQNALE
jgi:hypothetical protein